MSMAVSARQPLRNCRRSRSLRRAQRSQKIADPRAQIINSLPPVLQAAANAIFLGLTALLLYRVAQRRADKVTSKPFSSSSSGLSDDDDNNRTGTPEDSPDRPLSSLAGGVIALSLGFLTFQTAQQVDVVMLRSTGMLDSKGVELQQIGSTLRTIVSGIVYLAAFVFTFNGAGLLALTVRSALSGGSETSGGEATQEANDSQSEQKLDD